MDRLRVLTNAAYRARRVNEAFGSHLGPQDVQAQFADEDIDLIVAWMEHK